MYHHVVFDMEEILIEFMARLPLKSLIRCRAVSKSWLATIDSSSFRKVHFENQLSEEEDSNYLKIIYASDELEEFSIMDSDTGKSYNNSPSYQDFFKSNISGATLGFSRPVDGMICLYGMESTKPIALCNPFLQEIKILPPSPSPPPKIIPQFQSPYTSFPSRTVGLGYDDITEDYKVVQMSYDPSQRTINVQVYSRKENAWRVVLADLKDCFISKPISHVQPSSRTMTHWRGKKICEEEHSVIVSFDMRGEAFEVIKIPLIAYDQHLIEIFAKEEEDSFILFVFSGPERMVMWEYKSATDPLSQNRVPKRDWIKVGSFASYDPEWGWGWPAATWKSNGLVFKLYSMDKDRKLGFYDRASRKIIKYFHFPLRDDFDFEIVEYKGSFISP